ncbi:hypothetical protein CTA1_9769 [Colletotrichum tanaceti]|uniref:Heterokaryon incompatibility domain-containing protein n=1 Tax=Colletotrichum tanaceti TaxID=1306861 RepID=A0A4U6XBC9_9PEZI|nr:hypothetical protein CTA1_9769 [Colletotrichum tanaceti]
MIPHASETRRPPAAAVATQSFGSQTVLQQRRNASAGESEGMYGSDLDNIVYDQLPKTYKDALTVALALNFSFLWIDDIYGNAVLVIAVTSCTSVEDGFLSGARPSRNLTKFESHQNTQPRLEVHARPMLDHSWLGWSTMAEPKAEGTLSRSRCFQEEVLPARLLTFYGGEMNFQRLDTKRAAADESKTYRNLNRDSFMKSGKAVIEFTTSPLNLFYEPFDRFHEQVKDTDDVSVCSHPWRNSKSGKISLGTTEPRRLKVKYGLVVDGEKLWDYM